MSNAKTNKRKGSDAERYYADVFKQFGFSKCVTARLGSRLHDNAKIDLIHIPFNIQVKGGVQKNMVPGKVLIEMDTMIKLIFPKNHPVFEKPKIVIHRRQIYAKTNDKDTVYMSYKQYLDFRKIDKSLRYLGKRKASFKIRSQFNTIVSLSFRDFKNKIIPHYVKDIKQW